MGVAGWGHMWDINRVSERMGGSGPKAKSGEMGMGTDSTAEMGWGAGVRVSSTLLGLGQFRKLKEWVNFREEDCEGKREVHSCL